MPSDGVSGPGEKHRPSLMQIRSNGRSLLQTKTRSRNPVQTELAEVLSERARQRGSTLLAQVAESAAKELVGVLEAQSRIADNHSYHSGHDL